LPQLPAGSFPGRFRTTAPVPVALSRSAVVRNPSHKRTLPKPRPLDDLGRPFGCALRGPLRIVVAIAVGQKARAAPQRGQGIILWSRRFRQRRTAAWLRARPIPVEFPHRHRRRSSSHVGASIRMPDREFLAICEAAHTRSGVIWLPCQVNVRWCGQKPSARGRPLQRKR
jgi:hypothetical protein